MDWISGEAPAVLERLLPLVGTRFDGRAPAAEEAFRRRLQRRMEDLFRLCHELYGWRYDFAWQLEDLVLCAADAAAARPSRLRTRDEEVHGEWMHDAATVWAMAYADRVAGTLPGMEETVPHLRSLGVTHLHLMPPYASPPPGRNDGGYAVSDYRRVRADLGTMEDLRRLEAVLRAAGVGLVLDFVANHTADDHPWAEAAKRGEARFQAYYLMFDDRQVPDRYEPSLREIFPSRAGGVFTWRPDVAGPNGGKWVWTTFHEFQWDLDYRNPEVLRAMAGELLFLANLGAAVVRMDATPFLWKQEGTSCENLSQAHTVLRILSLLVSLVAPSVELLSEAIVHPDEVIRFVSPDECALAYNPLVMALTWEALATRDCSLLADALARRSLLPAGCQWVTYLRSHDDIGWGFSDEDARRLGIDPDGHRDFLNAFYAGEAPGSFARGLRFQENPSTGDARISGTLASLAGLEQALEEGDPERVELAVRRILAAHVVMLTAAGIPLLFLGDEVAQLNDLRALEDPLLSIDNRWVHRPRYDWELLAAAEEGVGPAAEVLSGVRRLLAVRTEVEAFGDGPPQVLPTGARSILAFRRAGNGSEAVVVVNLAEQPAEAILGIGEGWTDLLSGAGTGEVSAIRLEGYAYRLLGRPLA